MKKITLLTALLFLVTNTITAQEWDWIFSPVTITTLESFSFLRQTAVDTDAEGNVYMNCISTNQIVTFGDQTFDDTSMEINYLVKFNSSGSIVWINDGGEGDSMITTGISIDVDGNIYSVGEFSSSYSHYGYTFSTDYAMMNALITKQDSNGNMIWVKHMSVTGNPDNEDEYINRFIRAYDVVADNFGNTYVCGQMRGTAGIFDNLTVQNQGGEDYFIAKYDSNGNIVWIKTAVNNGYQSGHKIACDSAGNVYLAGQHSESGTINFDGHFLGGNTSITYVVKYSPAGEILWTRSHSGSDSMSILCYGISINDNGDIFTAGSFDNSSVTFGDFTLASPDGETQGFITKSNSSGDILWAKTTGPGSDVHDLIATDNKIYIIGKFWAPALTLEELTLVNEGESNGYLAMLNANGDYIWLEQIGGGVTLANYLGVDPANNAAYITGDYDTARFGNQFFTGPSFSNLFMAKFNMPEILGKKSFNKKINIFPNPASDVISFRTNELFGKEYKIIDMTGRIVQNGLINLNINISALTAGMYSLYVNDASIKFIKE